MELNKIYQGSCLELMQSVEDKSIDMILCDLPYGTTACKWDTIIPFEPLWLQYKRIIKDNGAIVLTASQPFTSALVMSNIKMFKYSWIWEKVRPIGHLVVRYRPMQKTEDVLVFGGGRINYYPIMAKLGKEKREVKKANGKRGNCVHLSYKQKTDYIKITDEKYPNNVLNFSSVQGFHPTQKPVALFEYLIKTYTNENELVLDNCIGSGTTAIACLQTNRNFIGMELSQEYCDIAENRITNFTKQLVLTN